MCNFFHATFQCSVEDHLLINEQWSDDQKKATYFLSKPSSTLCAFFSFEIGWRDDKLGVKVISPTTSQRSFPAIWRENKVPPLQTQRHNSSDNYIEMERRNDGNFLITREISSTLQAKIAWGIVRRQRKIKHFSIMSVFNYKRVVRVPA